MRQGNGDAGYPVHASGTVADAIAAVLKREGVEIVFGYPRNQILEAAARIDIRTVIVRQERTGLHMADAVSRMSKGEQMGVFVMQQGPGAENAFGGVAQAYRRQRAGAGHAAGLCAEPGLRAVQLQLGAFDGQRRQARRAADLARRCGGGDAPRVRDAAQRSAAAGGDRAAVRCAGDAVRGRARLRAGQGRAVAARAGRDRGRGRRR